MQQHDTDAPTPWEDSLILAFRDLQWSKKQRIRAKTLYKWLINKRVKPKTTRHLCQHLAPLMTPPPLLAKLDGHAESATGDVLTAVGQRYFLLEFKASRKKFKSEEGKFIYQLMLLADQPEHTAFVALSRRGHLLVYPTFPEDASPAPLGYLPVHQACLYCEPYLDACQGKSTEQDAAEPFKVDKIVWDPNQGLDVVQMAAYLNALCEAHSQGGSGHPMKAAIVSADGFFMPVSDLSSFLQFSQDFHLHLSANAAHLNELTVELNPVVDAWIASQQPAQPEAEQAQTQGSTYSRRKSQP